jgi:hypothetical protein
VHSSQISLDTLSTHLEREQRMIIDWQSAIPSRTCSFLHVSFSSF